MFLEIISTLLRLANLIGPCVHATAAHAITWFCQTLNKKKIIKTTTTTNNRMLQLAVLEGASNGALSPWEEQDISPGWKETNWACLEHSHFTTRWMCVCGRVWLYKGDHVCTLVCLPSYECKRVSICVHSSTRLVSQHLSGYMYRRAIYLSDFPQASQHTSHSESRDLYQIHID